MGWKPCCCPGCQNCYGPAPTCVKLIVSGVTKGPGDDDDHLDLNGYHHLARTVGGECRRLCAHTSWKMYWYFEDGNYYLGVDDGGGIVFLNYTHSGKQDPTFRLNLGSTKPSCSDMFIEGIQVPYNTGWHSRQTPVNNADFSEATVTAVVGKRDGVHCVCRGGPYAICGGSTSTPPWEYGICHAGRYPWGGIRIEIEGNNTPDIDGTYDLLGPPCGQNGGGIGWRFPIDLPGINWAAFFIASFDTSPGTPIGDPGTLSIIEFNGTHARYSDTALDRDCLSWDGVPLPEYDRYGSFPIYHFGGGTVTVSALEYP